MFFPKYFGNFCAFEETLVVSGAGPFTFCFGDPYLYVTDAGTSGDGVLLIYDFSNPAGPVLKSSTSTPSGSGPRKPYFDAATGLLYIPYRESNTVAIWNVDNASSPSLVGSVATTNSPWGVAVIGNVAAVVQCFNAGGGFPSMTAEKINVSNPASPTIVDSVNGFNPALNSSGTDVIVSSGNFILHGQVTGGSSTPYVSAVDPSSFNLLDSLALGAAGGSPTFVVNDETDGDYVYTYNGNEDNLYTVSISDPSNIVQASVVSSIAGSGSGAQHPIVSIADIDRLYVGRAGGGGLGIYILDISARSTPVEIGFLSSSGETVTSMRALDNSCAGFAWGQGTGAAIHLLGTPPLS